MNTPKQSNQLVAGKLIEYANLLAQQGADGFREQAYRRAAESLTEMPEPVEDVFSRNGINGLIALPAIGKGIATAITEMIVTGHWTQLERLRGDLSPEKLFQTIPGIGPELARRLAEEAHLETLQDLERVAHLNEPTVRGLGPRRREAIAAILGERLGRVIGLSDRAAVMDPPVALILKVDAMYRKRAADDTLRKIAPKRFNPSAEAWLPIMHASHGKWHFTALYSNTARANQRGRTHDWVVIYFHEDDHPEGRCTVVTEYRGPQAGRRVVRGREQECAHWYDAGES